MGILIIGGILLIGGILGAMIYNLRNKHDDIDGVDVFMAFCMALGFIIIVICSIIVISVQIPKHSQHESMLFQKEILEHRLEKEENVWNGNEDLYANIIDFNDKIRKSKMYKDNFWIGIYYNELYAEIDYIKLAPSASYVEVS